MQGQEKVPVTALNYLVINPFLGCNANCPTCEYRQELHRKSGRGKLLSLEDWKMALSQASALGAEQLIISGGEPTLYKQLPELVRLGREKGFYVCLKSNGGVITAELAEELMEAGLNRVSISLYSHIPEIHDRMKARQGIWRQACNALNIFSDLKKERPDFFLTTQTFISRENYQNFDELIGFHYRLGSEHLGISYLEGDYVKKEHLLTIDQIHYFRERVIPEAIRFGQKLEPIIREDFIRKLENLYHPEITSLYNFSRGLYHKKGGCEKPQSFAIILANGDVHPCNMVEYSHEPVIGNLFKKSFAEIYGSEAWNRFRENPFIGCRTDYCVFCPVPL
ncbi:MAG: radical SAM protein, partial [bacterium]